MAKKWVFEKLVMDDEPVSLISYALYKRDKYETAASLVRQQKSQAEIDQSLKDHHDNVLNSDRKLKRFRDDAEDLVLRIVTETEKQVEAIYKDRLERLNVKHRADIKKAERSAVTAYQKKLRSLPDVRRRDRFLGWMISGFSGLFAAFLLVITVNGFMGLAVDTPEEKEARWKALLTFIGTTTTTPPVTALEPAAAKADGG